MLVNLSMIDFSRANQTSHSSLLRVQRECVRKKEAAHSREPRALEAQMLVLKRKEQRILECEFRITRAVAAREEAQRVLAEESRLLSEAQAESRSRIGVAQTELTSVLSAVEDAEKRLEDKQTEKDELLETCKTQLQTLEAQTKAQEEEKIKVGLNPKP